MQAFVITVWRRDGAFHRFVRVAPSAAHAVRNALTEVYAAGVVQPGQVDGVSCHQVEYFDATQAIDEWLTARHAVPAPAHQPGSTVPVPARVLH